MPARAAPRSSRPAPSSTQTVANYRQTVLTAFQQVEDQLAALRILAEQAEAQDNAVAAAREAERIINNQYMAGTVAFTNVVVAADRALSNAETALNMRQSRLVAARALIQALGGGWDAAQLPSRGASKRTPRSTSARFRQPTRCRSGGEAAPQRVSRAM